MIYISICQLISCDLVPGIPEIKEEEDVEEEKEEPVFAANSEELTSEIS